jgi:hypothetical protein
MDTMIEAALALGLPLLGTISASLGLGLTLPTLPI